MIQVSEVKTKKQIKEFIEFPIKLYKGNKNFVPPLYSDEKKMFKSDYVYYDQSEAVFFNAYDNGKIVGRISGILQKVSNEKWNQKRVRFTRFDAINDIEVATALFSKVESWAKEKGMEEVVGPLGFSDLEREGLLVDGFDQVSTFEEQYNFPYYKDLIEKLGYVKEIGWTERQIRAPKVIDERIKRVSDMMMKKYKLHFSVAKNTKEFLDTYGDGFFEILDKTYVNVYGTVPFTEGMKKMMMDNFRLIIDVKHVAVILDENEKVVCFGICFPSLAKPLIGTKGKLTPIVLLKLLWAIKHPKVIDMGLIGVLPEYAMKGIATAIISQVMEMLTTGGVEYAETNLNLEDNMSIQNQWKVFDNKIHKRRSSYVKKIQ